MTNEDRDNLLIELKLKVSNVQDDVEQIKHVLLEGNGSPSLTAQVLTHKLKLERLEEERSDSKVPRSVWIGIVVSGLIGIGGIVSTLVK